MDSYKEKKLREEFCDILFELAKSQELFQDVHSRISIYKRLENLYGATVQNESFRHFYSDIFSVLTQIQQDQSLGDINILGQNLDMIRSGYKPQNKDDNGRIIDVSDSIKKLYDHVNLDIARILYSDAADRRIVGEETIVQLQTKVNEISYGIKEAKELQTITENKIQNQQKEYIAILGIFSSVVLTFNAGIAFSTSVLKNIAEASIYRIVLISLIIGIVLTNVIFGLLFYINKLICKEEKIKPIIISNIIFLIMILFTIVAWYFGSVEARNHRIIISTLIWMA